MARIIRDPQVADNICEVDFTATGAEADARRLYEAGNLVLLRGHRFDLDFLFLNSINFDVEAPPEVQRKIKKFDGQKISALTPDPADPIGQTVFEKVFNKDAGRLVHYKEQVSSGDAQVRSLYRRIFPKYRDTREVITWRFTETLFENMHWDNLHIEGEFHQVRIFCNIDRNPRIWRTTHQVEAFAQQVYDQYDLAQFVGRSGEDLATFFNKMVGGLSGACLDRLPKNHIAFAQGDIWLCETRIVSHQIYSGQKAIAAMFVVDPSSMDDPSLAFEERVRRLHAQRAQAALAPVQ